MQLHRRRRLDDTSLLLEDDTTMKQKYKINQSSSLEVLTLLVLFYVGLILVVIHCYTRLPVPKSVHVSETQFSEGRVRLVLDELVSLGIRTVGNPANEVEAPRVLINHIQAIAEVCDPERLKFELDVQHPTGAFGLNFLSQFQNVYANITNVLVRLTPVQYSQAHNTSVLISSHYDTAPGTRGASDDGVNIAIMIELLRYFTHNPPKYVSLIFNFNGIPYFRHIMMPTLISKHH